MLSLHHTLEPRVGPLCVNCYDSPCSLVAQRSNSSKLTSTPYVTPSQQESTLKLVLKCSVKGASGFSFSVYTSEPVVLKILVGNGKPTGTTLFERNNKRVKIKYRGTDINVAL